MTSEGKVIAIIIGIFWGLFVFFALGLGIASWWRQRDQRRHKHHRHKHHRRR